MPITSRRSLRLAIGAAAILAGVCSCSQSAPGGATAGQPAEEPVDACAQIPPTEVASLIGPKAHGKPGTDDDAVSCTWENPDTSASMTLEIRASGTATGGRLPDPEPAQSAQPIPNSDGMLLVAGDQVEFAAGDRLCFLFVSTDVDQPDKDRATAVRLARDIRGKL